MQDDANAFDPDTPAAIDAASASIFADRKARLTKTLLEGETGVQFESLALFAEPFFAMYDLDVADAFKLRTEPKAVADDAVALLETARVLWAYMSLSPSARAHRRPVLAAQLVGNDPTEEDWAGLDGLVETARIHWKALLPEEIEAAQSTGHPVLEFDDLLHHPAFRVGSEDDDATHAGYGPNGLSETEARALFAQPLLDDPEVLIDPDAFEDALERADDYWSLARSVGSDLEAEAEAWASQHAASDADQAPLAAEAVKMVNRFRELFPELG
ncbi:hypothetical protein [Rubrivirga sp.]|uniref:hypothetical protein n=1 Tax=Rubrivirga sp. TaxID=1885344 RepID=UPI003C74DF0D